MYSPTLARWLQRDPKGYEDGIDLYAYVGCRPITRIDPTGRKVTPGQVACTILCSAACLAACGANIPCGVACAILCDWLCTPGVVDPEPEPVTVTVVECEFELARLNYESGSYDRPSSCDCLYYCPGYEGWEEIPGEPYPMFEIETETDCGRKRKMLWGCRCPPILLAHKPVPKK